MGFDDIFGSSTFAKDLVRALKILILKNATGVFHLAGKGRCSRYDMAKLIVKKLKPEIEVKPVKGYYFNLPAKRIRNEALSSKIKLMRPWQKALEEYLETELR